MGKNLLLFIFVLTVIQSYANVITIHKTDGNNIEIEAATIEEITFLNSTSESLIIHFENNTDQEILLADIDNIQFVETPNDVLKIVKTDGSELNVIVNQLDRLEFNLQTGTEESVIHSLLDLKSVKNYPNPFNPETSIIFTLKMFSQVDITIYNIKGQVVKTFLNKSCSAGINKIFWQGDTDSGDKVQSGIYFCKVSAGNAEKSFRMILLK